MYKESIINRLQEKKYHSLFESYIENETPYQLERMLGMGSYGIAYLLKDKQSSKRVVLKRLRRKHSKKSKSIHFFNQEIEILNILTIPNIPTILTIGDLENIPYYIMEYIDGSTFEHFIFQQNIKFSISESLDITAQLLEIVIKIHQHGIVHRDLRIPNILMKNNQLFVIDFGLATYMNKDSINIDLPNPKKGEDHRSDLYFIGHFLLYLLYSNYHPTSKKERSWQEELQLPIDIQNFIERLLLIQPAFSSANEAYLSLQTIIRNLHLAYLNH